MTRLWHEPAPEEKRRYDIQQRAHDGKWVLWQRIPPPPFISMAWQAIAVTDTRKAAFKHMWNLIGDEHQEATP